MDIHLVRVPQYVDVVNVRWKPAKWGERPALFPVHVDSYARGFISGVVRQWIDYDGKRLKADPWWRPTATATSSLVATVYSSTH